MVGFYFDYHGEYPDEPMDSAESEYEESRLASRDVTVRMEHLELADWHDELLKEIQKLRGTYLTEIKNAYHRVYEFGSQSLEAAKKVDGDRRFLESALKILDLTPEVKFERPNNKCFHALTLIESYVLRSRNENLIKPYEEHPQTPVLQYRGGATVSGDPFVQIWLLELAEWNGWKEDLREEIEWMKWKLLPEINLSYMCVCRVLCKNPDDSTMEEDKIFIEFSFDFLGRTDDEIKWPKNECFDIVRRIKSYVLHLRDTKYAEHCGEHLWIPECHYKIPPPQKQLSKKIGVYPSALDVPCETLSLCKWPRLANLHNLMYEEFVSAKNDFSTIVTMAFRMYCKLSLKNRKKYLPLAFSFEFCMKFLRFSRSDVLLISKDQFDYYVRKIKMLVNGVDSVESMDVNNGGAATSSTTSSNPGLGFGLLGLVDRQENLEKQVELIRTMELPEINKFFERVCKKCSESAELEEEDKRALSLALLFLKVKGDEICELGCDDAVVLVKLYALRSRNEYLAQHCEQQQHLRLGVWADHLHPNLAVFSYGGFRDWTIPNEQVGLADWVEYLLNEIKSTRSDLSEIEGIYREVCLSQSGRDPDEIAFLEMALEFLLLGRNDKINRPKCLCFAFLEQIKLYVEYNREYLIRARQYEQRFQ